MIVFNYFIEILKPIKPYKIRSTCKHVLNAGEERGDEQAGPRGPVQVRLRGDGERVQQAAEVPLLRGDAPNTRGLNT